MRLTKKTIAIVFILTISGIANSAQDDSKYLSAFYGFGEMEMIKLNWNINSMRIVDLNGDGRNDIAVVNNSKARIELLIQKEALGPPEEDVVVDQRDVDINLIAPPTRFRKEFVPVSQKVRSFVCGDLDSDGLIDLAFYGVDPKGLYVILQKKPDSKTDKSTELKWQTRKKIKIDDALQTSSALICADLNNDGAKDLALAARKTVYIILQKEDGSLAEPIKYPVTTQILGIETADFNGDKINDLLILTGDREKPLQVRFGLKTGQLGPQIQFFIEKPYALKFYDIDDSKGDEILAVDYQSGRLTCYKLSPQTRPDADWPISFYPLTSGKADTKRDLVLGDFDGNGLTDIVVSEPGAAELILYRQAKGLGLLEPVKFPAFADITSLSAGNIDKNKRTELAVLSVKEKVIGLSRYKDDRLLFPEPIEITGEPLAMQLVDMDDNGKSDWLYISKDTNDIRSLNVIYNGKRSESLPSLEIKELESNPSGIKAVDVDQDGLMDVLIFVPYEDPILVRQTKKKVFEVIDSTGTQASLIKQAKLPSIAIADVADSYKKAELLLAQNNFARSLIFKDSRIWKVIDQYNAKGTENNIAAVAAFDIDNKGNGPSILLLDAQKGNLQILKAGDDKTYRFKKELDVGRWSAADHLKILFASLTGRPDIKNILLFDSQKFALVTAPTAKAEAQYMEQQFNYATKIKDGVYGNMVLGDINSDGKPEIIMVEYKRNHIEILALDENGLPVPAMRFKIFEQKSYREQKRGKSSVEPRELRVADVTGDGKDDLVTVIHDRIIIYPQD